MSKVVVADADALIALALENDAHHLKAVNLSKKLLKEGTVVIFPVTVFPEAITTLKRAFNQPQKADLINKQLQRGMFQIEYIDSDIMNKASQLFAKTVSKQNTFFDCLVAATAEKLGVDTIFSFDSWYPKLGLKLL